MANKFTYQVLRDTQTDSVIKITGAFDGSGQEDAEHQNQLDMRLDQSKEKNPSKVDENYKPTFGVIKKVIAL